MDSPCARPVQGRAAEHSFKDGARHRQLDTFAHTGAAGALTRPQPPLELTVNRTLFTLIPLTASLCIAPFLAHAQDAQITPATTISNAECAGAAHLSHLHGRIVEKAAQGIVPLHQFIWRTRMIYQLDLMESVAWLDQRRALLVACEQRSARIEPGAAARQ